MTTPLDVLQLLLALLEKQESTKHTNHLDVVAIHVQELGEYLPLINEVMRTAGGVLLEARDHTEGTEGTLDLNLKEVVKTTLNFQGVRVGRPEVEVHESGSTVHVTLDGSSVDDTISPGLRTLSGVATALFNDRLRARSFAAITYNESGLADDVADAIWQLLTKQIGDVGVGNLRTLVVFVEGRKVQYDRHFSQGNSVVFRLGEYGFQRRKSWDVDCTDIAQLRAHRNQCLVLFLGAGFSASSRLPLGNELRDEALTRFLNPSNPFAPYEQLVQQFRQWTEENGRSLADESTSTLKEYADTLTLERVVREEVFRHGSTNVLSLQAFKERNANVLKSPGAAVRALHRLIERAPKLVIVTVNFDTLIESKGGVHVFASPTEFESCPAYLDDYLANGGAVPMLKLHGTIDEVDTVVATVDQMAMGLAVSKEESLRRLLDFGDPLQWVYVGYSMRDPDVTSVLGQAAFGEGLDESWVDPFPAATVQSFVNQHRRYAPGRNFWQRSITETADEFMRELSRVW